MYHSVIGCGMKIRIFPPGYFKILRGKDEVVKNYARSLKIIWELWWLDGKILLKGLTPKTCETKGVKGSNDQLYIKGCFSKQNGKNIYNILVVSVHIFSAFTKVWDRV